MTTGADIVTALEYNGGISKKLTELFSTRQQSSAIVALTSDQVSAQLRRIGRLNEISYQLLTEVASMAHAYEYTGCEPVFW